MQTTAWDALRAHMKELNVLDSVRATVTWDQQTMMPPKAAGFRGQQTALLYKLSHERFTDPKVGEWLATIEAAGPEDEVQAASLRNIKRDYERATKVPERIVTRMGELQSEGFVAWMKAREEADYSVFKPVLEETFALTKERAEIIDSSRHVYDVLLDEFDPGTTTESLRHTFARLRDGLGELIGAVSDLPAPGKLDATFPVAGQRTLFNTVIGQLGYDLQAGRLDDAQHPFTIRLGTDDVRITTHLYDDDLLAGLGGTVHETGHAMYEQGLPMQWHGTGVEKPASFGLHESQSRFWENFIGRSDAFFQWFEGQLRETFPASTTTASDLYRAANRIQPGLIRVYADEVTYNLHIIVRFELELALLEGTLSFDDLPDAWNEKYQRYLGIVPDSVVDGVLQDVHWSGAAIAYFPSYTLGNLYAASLGHVLLGEQPDLWDKVREGDFADILSWLRTHVHSKGSLKEAPEIVGDVVGERDHVEDLLTYLWGRHGALYGVTR